MNFTYLEKYPKFQKLYTYCTEAEDLAVKYPSLSAASARKAMEFIVKLLYSSIVGQDYGFTVFEMITDVRFAGYINDSVFINSVHYIRKIGNIAAHGGDITKEDSLKVLEELHFVVGEFCILLGLTDDYPEFISPEYKPAATTSEPTTTTTKEKVVVAPEIIAEFAPRMRATRFQVHHGRNEEENKQLYLKASLREARWPIVNKVDQAMPGSAGLNMLLDDGDTVDYILYGRDNRPLAIIEYTTTTKNIVEGRMKAIDKANKLSVKLGYKPIVYYTNGYHIYVIDQLGYKPRRVFQFHTIEELELLKLRF